MRVAQKNLLEAAATKPLYPTLHVIRYLMTSALGSVTSRDCVQWRELVSGLVQASLLVAEVVSPVVAHSSPEGHVPDDAVLGNTGTLNVRTYTYYTLEA